MTFQSARRDAPTDVPHRPRSAVPFWPAFAVYGCATFLILGFSLAQLPPLAVALTGIFVVTGGSLWIEIAAQRRHGRPDGIVPPGPKNWGRVRVKLIGLFATLVVVCSVYALVAPVLAKNAGLFFAFLPVGLIAMTVIAPLLFVETDRRMADPEDAYFQLGQMCLLRTRTPDWAALRTHALGWTIKAFFLPMMFTWYFKMVFLLGGMLEDGSTVSLAEFFLLAMVLLFSIDLLGAAVGYSLTFKWLGTHIRSTNKSVTGWVAALMCYPPFYGVMEAISKQIDDLGWIEKLEDQNVALLCLGAVIVTLQVTYVLATVGFGGRFSNLTHRGIVTDGLYRWVKHPAYLSKNLFWWVMTVPFIMVSNHALWVMVCVATVNIVYFVRAKTEELHLLDDPDYRAYAEWIEEHGLFAPLARFRDRVRFVVQGGPVPRRENSPAPGLR